MNIKVAYDYDENEYICFVDKYASISGYGSTEKEAILDLLYKALNENGWNHDTIKQLIQKIENEN